MKLLAAGEPLSLQVHPTSEQARLRYAAENAAGVPLDAPNRSYVDASHKPELIYALTRFEGMAGFRDAHRTAVILRELGLPWLDRIAERLDGTATPFQTLREIVTEVLAWEGLVLERRLDQLATAALHARNRLHQPPTRMRPAYQSAESVQREVIRVSEQTAALVGRYPADPGVVVTLLLNHVVLAAGEAMFLPAGIIHAYTSGFGVEIMASSDNVLRAGLTPKHVDIPELLEVTDFRPTPPPRWSAADAAANGVDVFSPPVGEFSLTMVNRRPEVAGVGPAIMLCLDGTAEVATDDFSDQLKRGDSVFVASGAFVVHASVGRVAIGACPLAGSPVVEVRGPSSCDAQARCAIGYGEP
jgi:mannose-6-phosphate isomerase